MLENIVTFVRDWTGSSLSMTIWRVLLGALILVLVLFSRKAVDNYLIRKIYKWAERTKFAYDEQIIQAIAKPFDLAILFLGFYLSFKVIGFEQLAENININDLLDRSLEIAVAGTLIWAAYRLSDVYSYFLTRRFSSQDEVMQKQFIPLISRSIKTFIIVVGGLLIVQNMGYSIGSLLTGLGIGGLAVALAAQDTLANFFSSLMLLTDMPFRVGDWVKFNDVEGVIETIGFRTTRVRTFEKALITIPNKIFMNTPIENFSMRDRRRIYMNLGITYDTTPEKVEEFIAGIKSLLKNHALIHQDFYLVNWDKYTDCTLNIMIYCFTTTTVWDEYLRIQEELNLAFLRMAAKLGIDYAFPSQTLYWGKNQSVEAASKPN